MSSRKVFLSVIFFLVTAGWAANHFAAVLVALKERAHLEPLLVNGAYGIYAAGLFPCLLAGGILADRFGGRPIVIAGTIVSALGVYLSLAFDLPTGATIVCTFGVVLILMAAARPLLRAPARA